MLSTTPHEEPRVTIPLGIATALALRATIQIAISNGNLTPAARTMVTDLDRRLAALSFHRPDCFCRERN
jgi:hypothetical protein